MNQYYFLICLSLSVSSMCSEQKTIAIQKQATEAKSHYLLEQIQSELNGFLQDDYNQNHAQNFLNFIINLVPTYPNFKQAIDNGTTPATAPQTGTIGSPDPILERAWLESKSPYTQEGLKNYTDKSLKILNENFTPEFIALDKLLNDIREKIYILSKDDLEKLQNDTAWQIITRRLQTYANTLNETLPKVQARYENNTTPASAPQTILAGQTATQMNATENLMLYAQAEKEFIETLKKEINQKVHVLLHAIESIKNRITRALDLKK